MAWDDAYRAFLRSLEDETGKPVVTCGDFNVAHNEIDLKNPKSNRRQCRLFRRGARSSASCWMRGTPTRSAPPTPTWRAPTAGGATASTRARTTRAGASTTSCKRRDRRPRAPAASRLTDIFGSDHCPVTLEIEL
ncbi:MAG: endonuclease/exonuclease/phosphatase family protein [Collinsella sp.]